MGRKTGREIGLAELFLAGDEHNEIDPRLKDWFFKDENKESLMAFGQLVDAQEGNYEISDERAEGYMREIMNTSLSGGNVQKAVDIAKEDIKKHESWSKREEKLGSLDTESATNLVAKHTGDILVTAEKILASLPKQGRNVQKIRQGGPFG